MEFNKKIVFLARNGEAAAFIYNFLKNEFHFERVIIEKPVSKKQLIRRRIKKLGFIKVSGQLLFQVFVQPLVKMNSKKRHDELVKIYGLDATPIPQNQIHQVNSVNDDDTVKYITQLRPNVVVINGTRILSKKLLYALDCPVLNIHAGITPAYRGVHGGYWALANNDRENCGVTVHLVDPGIDTGSVIYQEKIEVSRKDNFSTYPIHQLGTALPRLRQAIRDAIQGSIKTIPAPEASKLWYHPTVGEYIFNFLFKRVK